MNESDVELPLASEDPGALVAAPPPAPASMNGAPIGALPTPVEPAHLEPHADDAVLPGTPPSVAGLSVAPLPPPPKPKPVIVPERCDGGWQTGGMAVRRASGGYFVEFLQEGHKLSIHVTPPQLSSLLALLDAEPGGLWRTLCDLPLERPRPSRALEEELRVLLKKFGSEMGASRR